jgi:hypothetical protein
MTAMIFLLLTYVGIVYFSIFQVFTAMVDSNDFSSTKLKDQTQMFYVITGIFTVFSWVGLHNRYFAVPRARLENKVLYFANKALRNPELAY